MRICHITSMHEWNDDRIFQRACLALAREGHEVSLVATQPDGIDPMQIESPVRFYWIKRRKGIKRRILSSREAVSKAIQANAAIYHFHDPDLLPFVMKIKKAVPSSVIIYDIHENYGGRFGMWGLPKSLAGFCSRQFRNFEIRTINKLDGFTVVSNSMKQLFERSPKPSVIIRNSTDLARLKHMEGEISGKCQKPYIIYTSGTNSHQRDCLQTVQSLKYILQEDKDVKMMFVGKYPGNIKEEMKAQAEKDGTADKLVMEGMMPWEENFRRTAQAFCGCVFYADNPNNRVGIPNRLFEYMYTGIPIVASNFPELRNIVTEADCGVLVDSSDPKSIASGIGTLLRDPKMARQKGLNGKKAMEEKFGFHIDLKNLIEFYKSLIGK